MNDAPELPLDAAHVVDASNGRLVAGRATRAFTRVSIDSRTLKPGDLFVAIRGERFDGHEFLPAALAAGASGVVVSRAETVSASGADGPVVIVVGDTTRALQLVARDVRRRSGARVVAITGSAGKTTTKEVTAELLSVTYQTFRNEGNLNNHIGLPLSLLALRQRPRMAVVELGMSAPGEIRRLVEIAEPDVRVWTNVGEAHLESFPSVDAIADAKAEILEGATPDTRLVANANDARVMQRVRGFVGRVRTFGIDVDADVSARHVVDRGLDGLRADVSTPAGAGVLETPLVGRANLSNILAAMTVALDEGVPLDAMLDRARSLAPAKHRGQVRRLSSGVTVLDDAYNANPLAMRKALDVLTAAHADRRVAVLGEMLELGPESVALHEGCGEAAARAGVDRLITVGGEAARALGEAAVRAGVSRDHVRHVADSQAAADLAADLVRAGDVVLVKGSRGVRLERVVERLSVNADKGADNRERSSGERG